MATHRRLPRGAMFAILVLVGASGCGATASVGTRTTVQFGRAQAPGTCKVAPPRFRIPTGEWTTIFTILTTNAVDACAGERLVRPWDFRRRCRAGHCKTRLYTVSDYGVAVAEVVPNGQGGYIATFRPETVPCPHQPGEDTGTNQDRGTMTLWWSADKNILHGTTRDVQAGACSSGLPETSSFEAQRTNPAATPPAEGP